MAERYTVKDVQQAFANAGRAAQAVGIDPTGWILSEGNRTQGRPYRLHGPDMHNLPFTSGNGFLGDTAKQAYDALWHYAGAWHAVALLNPAE